MHVYLEVILEFEKACLAPEKLACKRTAFEHIKAILCPNWSMGVRFWITSDRVIILLQYGVEEVPVDVGLRVIEAALRQN